MWKYSSPVMIEIDFLVCTYYSSIVMTSSHKILICSLCNALGPFLLSTYIGVPCIASFICWLFLRKDADAEVADYARRRLNVALSWMIWFYISMFLCAFLIGFIPLFVLGVWWIVAGVKDLIRASSGDTSYRFGLTLELLRAPKSGS